MWLCDNPHGAVLVHRVYPSGCDRAAACHSVPHDGYYGVRRGISNCILYSQILISQNQSYPPT